MNELEFCVTVKTVIFAVLYLQPDSHYVTLTDFYKLLSFSTQIV